MPNSEVVTHIVNGIGMLGQCINSQVLAGVPLDTASDRTFLSFKDRFNELPRLNAEDEMRLIGSIGGAAQWSADQKQELVSLVHDHKTRKKTVGSARAKLQKCLLFENLITDAMWSSLKEEGRLDTASACILCQLASNLGIINGSEKTLNRLVAIVGFCQRYTRLDQRTVTKLKIHIQEQLHCLGKSLPADYPYMLAYRVVYIMRACFSIDRSILIDSSRYVTQTVIIRASDHPRH